MTIAELSLKQAREKLGARQDELGKVFTEAKTDDGQYDFGKVTCLGADVKGSIAVAEKVKAMNSELDELAKHAETLEGAELAAAKHGEREKARRGFVLPGFGGPGSGSKGNYGSEQEREKSLGEMIAESKAYQDWSRSGGVDLSFPDLYPSDMMAKGAQFDTLGGKTLMATGAGYAPEVIRAPGFVDMVTRPIQLLDIIPMFQTTQAAYKYMEETTRTHAAAETAEGGTYAEDTYAFTEKISPVQKITSTVPVTDEQLDDVDMIQGYLNARLTFGVRQRFDGQCLIGNGTTPNLRGLKNTVGIQTQAKGADPVLSAFYKGLDKVRVTGRSIPTHFVIHSTDWQAIRLDRTPDGVYIWGNPSEAGMERLWGLPVVQQQADAAGTGYVGSFLPDAVSIHERKGIDIQMGYVGTQFAEGKRTVRADMRVALVFQRPAAFCSVTGL